MGVYDDINVYMECPFCHRSVGFDAQTKDLSCAMFQYRTLPDDWFTSKSGKKFRTNLPAFPKFPLDKGAIVWKDQAERREAQATIEAEFANQLRYVNVVTCCPKCDQYFDGKIRIENGMLVGEIYDILVYEVGNIIRYVKIVKEEEK